MYPGDLTNFFTTEPPGVKSSDKNNDTTHLSSNDSSNNIQYINSIRSKRSLYNKKEKENGDALVLKNRKPLKAPQYKFKYPEMSESRLSASYHKPSVSVMNDIPAEMYFDGAGFLRYEDDSEESSSSSRKPQNYERTNSRSQQDNSANNNKALKEFRDVFNISRERDVKFDDDAHYPDSSIYSRITQEKTADHGTEGTENVSPLGIDFMNAYQRDMFANMHNNYAQMAQTPSVYQQDPFSFTYPNFYNTPQNFNQMPTPVVQQEPLLQNHRLQSPTGITGATSSSVYSSSTSQPQQTNSGYASNLNYQQYAKIQRRRRSVMGSKSSDEAIALASDPNQDHYTYSRVADQQDSSSGFIPITGSFNGGTIQLNFPIFGGNPSYSPRPPIQTYHTYSVPLQPNSRPYRSSMERFYHPSEARRYSYGILGSGNFEVIRGGVFPSDRQPGGFVGGGFSGERIPYNNGFGNYGTTEIILDGPIQGFQGFDNFPAHLINALSKHSELAIHPDRREAKEVAS